MDFAQTNELQDAIDEMANKNVVGSAEADAGAGVGVIQDQFGVPPVPPMDGMGAPGVATPEVPAMDLPTPEAMPVEEAPVAGVQVEQTAVAPAEVPVQVNNTPAAEAVPVAEVAPVVTEESATVETVPVENVPVSPEMAGGDAEIDAIRQSVLKDLLGTGLIDKTSVEPQEKFQIYMDAMNSMHDKSLVSGAYKTASAITDENAKAESLIKLMQVIDVLK